MQPSTGGSYLASRTCRLHCYLMLFVMCSTFTIAIVSILICNLLWKSLGPDDILPLVLKKTKDIISGHLGRMLKKNISWGRAISSKRASCIDAWERENCNAKLSNDDCGKSTWIYYYCYIPSGTLRGAQAGQHGFNRGRLCLTNPLSLNKNK